MSFPEYYDRTFDPEDDLVPNPPALAQELRVPLLTSEYPRWNYVTGIVVRDEMHFEMGVMPTDNEIRMVGSFLEEYCQHWYRDSFRAAMRHFAPYDIDGGANLAYLIKGADGGWHYRKRTWSASYQHWWPDYYHSEPFSLVGCLDRLHAGGDGAVRDRWAQWKLAHNDIFEAVS